MYIITHDSDFHADEVFAMALLRLWGSDRVRSLEIIRTRDIDVLREAKIKGWILVDVGEEYNARNLFDHHQDSLLPASQILVAKSNLIEVDADFRRFLIEKLQPISLLDCGDATTREVLGQIKVWEHDKLGQDFLFTLNGIIRLLFDRGSENQSFEEALQFATMILKSWEREYSRLGVETEAWKNQMEWIPGTTVLVNHGEIFVSKWKEWADRDQMQVYFHVAQSDDKHWIVISRDSSRWPLVCVKDRKDYKDLVFEHKTLFFAKFLSKESAIKLALESSVL